MSLADDLRAFARDDKEAQCLPEEHIAWEAADEIERLISELVAHQEAQRASDHMLQGLPGPGLLKTRFQLLADDERLDCGVRNFAAVSVEMSDALDQSPERRDTQAACVNCNDYRATLADHDRLVRELDVLLNGEHGAAKQASLCDIVGQVRDERLCLWRGAKPVSAEIVALQAIHDYRAPLGGDPLADALNFCRSTARMALVRAGALKSERAVDD